MKKYLILIFLTLVLFSTHQAYSQENPIPSSDVVFALDYSGILKTNVSASLTVDILSKILGDLSRDSRISFVVFAEQPELALPLTPINEGDANEKIADILDRFIHSGTIATVTIQSGDTLWSLAGKYYGDPFQWPPIMTMNRITNAGKSIAVGTAIHIPGKGAMGLFRGHSQGDYINHINMPEAIERSIYELKHSGRKDAKKLIILMTDGIIDVRDGVWSIERYRWLKDELTAESKEAGIQIFSIILTDQADFEMMQILAKQTNGGYYRVLKDEDAQLAVSGIMGSLETTIADQKQEQIAVTGQEEIEVIASTEAEGSFPWMLVLTIVAGAAAIGIIAFAVTRSKAKTSKDTGLPEAYLMDLSGVTDRKTYMIDKRAIKIGRASGTDIDLCISRITVSAGHARIEYKDNAFYLIDLGSKNGTYLNEKKERITGEVSLKTGDIISFEQYQFKFVVRGQVKKGQTQISPSESINTQLSPASGTSTMISTKDVEDVQISQVIEELENIEAYLIDAGEATNEKTHKINKRVVKIGRLNRDDIDICIAQNTVSAEHAQIEYKDNSFYLLDLGSRNGTYLNEGKERITSEVHIENDDIIYFDQYRFRFVLRDQDIRSEAS